MLAVPGIKQKNNTHATGHWSLNEIHTIDYHIAGWFIHGNSGIQ
jgi:hypothetical protein